MLPVLPQALLALADGTVFLGTSIGAAGHTVGEVVFNTSITGYQEILTDPSYCRQIVTLTYPHIGNYGVNGEDVEATKVHAAGLIIKDLPIRTSNFRQTRTLSQYLQDEGTVGIANIDTRKLTRILRSKGAQNGCIVALAAGQDVTDAVIADAVAKKSFDCVVAPGITPDITLQGLLPLTDDKTALPVDMVVPLLAIDASQPELVSMLTTINASLTTDVVRALLVKVGNGTNTYDTAAKAFLASLSSNG